MVLGRALLAGDLEVVECVRVDPSFHRLVLAARGRNSISVLLVEVVPAEPVRPLESFTAFDRARTTPLHPVLPVIHQTLLPGEVLLPLVRLGQMLVHEGDQDVDVVMKRLDRERHFIVVVGLAARVPVHAARSEERPKHFTDARVRCS